MPIPPTLAAALKVRDTPFTPTAATATKVAVTLDQHVVSSFDIDNIQAIQSRPDVMSNYGEAAAIAIAERVETTILQQYANASGSVGTAGTPLTIANLRTARTNLTKAKAPLAQRAAFINPDSADGILGTLSTTNAGAMFNDQTSLREGSIGRLYGFDIYESQLTPVVTGTPDATHGIALHRDAITLVTRPLPAPDTGTGVASVTVSDPDIGMTMRVMMSYNHTNTNYIVSYDVLFGVATTRADFMVDLIA